MNIQSSDKSKGKRFNKLVNNQWNRSLLTHILEKNCNLYQIYFQKVIANYSSFLGNLVYRQEKLPDPCLSSIEIGRRAYEFYHQYILKDKEKQKNIIFDKLENVKNKINQSLEELNYFDTFSSLLDLYYKLKKMKCSYRFPLEKSIIELKESLFRKFYTKSYREYYIFN